MNVISMRTKAHIEIRRHGILHINLCSQGDNLAKLNK
jgi:hypothetical protein